MVNFVSQGVNIGDEKMFENDEAITLRSKRRKKKSLIEFLKRLGNFSQQFSFRKTADYVFERWTSITIC